MFNMIKLNTEFKNHVPRGKLLMPTFYHHHVTSGRLLMPTFHHHHVTSVILLYCNCHETLMYCILIAVAIWQIAVHKINKLLISNQLMCDIIL